MLNIAIYVIYHVWRFLYRRNPFAFAVVCRLIYILNLPLVNWKKSPVESCWLLSQTDSSKNKSPKPVHKFNLINRNPRPCQNFPKSQCFDRHVSSSCSFQLIYLWGRPWYAAKNQLISVDICNEDLKESKCQGPAWWADGHSELADKSILSVPRCQRKKKKKNPQHGHIRLFLLNFVFFIQFNYSWKTSLLSQAHERRQNPHFR